MKIKSFIGGFDKNISYLIWCESTRRAGIVDAAVDISEIIEIIESKNLILEKLFITHSHIDQIRFLEEESRFNIHLWQGVLIIGVVIALLLHFHVFEQQFHLPTHRKLLLGAVVIFILFYFNIIR